MMTTSCLQDEWLLFLHLESEPFDFVWCFRGGGHGPDAGGVQWQPATQSERGPGREKQADPGEGAWQRSVHDSSPIKLSLGWNTADD